MTIDLRLPLLVVGLLGVTASDGGGVVDSGRLRPGDEVRLGSVTVRLEGFDAYLTFLSRRDPGMGLLFGGAGLLVASLATALWLPRRRMSVRLTDGALRVLMRGERFDRPAAELAALTARLAGAAGPRAA